MSSGENEFVVRFHAIFSLAAALALRSCLQQTHSSTKSIGIDDGVDACGNVGNTVSLLVVAWHLTIFLRGLLQYPRLLSFYRFLLPLSLFFVLPDWFLVSFAGTLEFPRNGSFWMIGNAVSPCMAGMWSIPGLLILKSCYPADEGSGSSKTRLTAVCYAKAAVAGLVVFGTAEQCLPFIWTATEHVVRRVGWGEGIAMYVMPAEALLGPMILYCYHVTKDATNWYQPVIAAGMTMLMYTGALSIGLLVWEGSPRRLTT